MMTDFPDFSSQLYSDDGYVEGPTEVFTQVPVHIPRWVVDQASFTWIGRIRDEERQKRLVQIGGLARQDLPYVASLEKRQWLIAADPLDMYARTIYTDTTEGGEQ